MRGYNGGVGAEPPAGSRGRAPGQRVRGAKPPEAETFFVDVRHRFRQISPLLMFGVKSRKRIFKHSQTTNTRPAMLSLTWMLWRSVNCCIGLYSTCWHELLSFNNTPFDDWHSKFALRPHHVPKYGKHPIEPTAEIRRGKKEEERRKN